MRNLKIDLSGSDKFIKSKLERLAKLAAAGQWDAPDFNSGGGGGGPSSSFSVFLKCPDEAPLSPGELRALRKLLQR